jgi:hypothetical protein
MVAVGTEALSNNTGSSNTALGRSALYANTTASNNTAVGYQAAYNNTTGTIQAFGKKTLYSNTTGVSNVAVGNDALLLNTTGSYNVAMGYDALALNTTASYNTAVGVGALKLNTTASQNTAVGFESLRENTTGSDNTAVGLYAGLSNTTGNYNVAFGTAALRSNTTASYNTTVGYQAGYANTTGTGNTFIGLQTGYNNTTGNYNTFIGPAGPLGASGSYVTTGSKNTIVGAYSGNQGGLDIRTSDNHIVLSDGDGNPRLIIDNSGFLKCVGVYNQSAADSANVVVDSVGNIYRSTSALKYKQDIRDIEEIDISQFRPIRYKSNLNRDDQTKDHFGFIADEAHDAGYTELVSYGAVDEETGIAEVEGFRYDRMTVLLTKVVQQQQETITALEARIAALES